MPNTLERCVNRLRRQSERLDRAGSTDRTLLEAFAKQRDEASFEELMRRHGTMVFAVCRRFLGNVQDAEDAYQATFLVLARKAGSIPWKDCVKSWLYGVACRVAMKARGRAYRRREREANNAAPEVGVAASPAHDALRGELDEAMLALPERYRAVLLLCCIEGKSRDEAADELGWSVGSVKGCLERGREMLRERLARKGIALGTALTLGIVGSANAAPSQALAGITLKSAVAFTTGIGGTVAVSAPVSSLALGVLNAMMLAKLKTSVLGFAFALVAAAVVTVAAVSPDARVAASPENVALAAQDGQPREKKAEPGRRDENAKKAEPGRRDENAKKAEPGRRDGENGRDPNALRGLIKEIDIKVGTITIQHIGDGKNGDGIFNIADKALKPTTSSGKALTLADLTPGTRVILTAKDQDVTAIRVENPVAFSFIANVDIENKIVQLRMENQSRKLPVADDAVINVLGRRVKLAEVPTGERAMLTLSLDKSTIVGIDIARARAKPAGVEGRPVREGERERAIPQAHGTIVEIDAKNQTLNLLLGRDGDLKLQTVAIGKDSKIALQFDERTVRDLSFAELTKPMLANIQLAEDGRTVKTLNVLAPTIRGVFKAFDSTKKKVSLVTDARVEKKFDADTASVVTLQGRAGKLADIPAGTPVLVAFSPDRSRVIAIVGLVRRGDGDGR